MLIAHRHGGGRPRVEATIDRHHLFGIAPQPGIQLFHQLRIVAFLLPVGCVDAQRIVLGAQQVGKWRLVISVEPKLGAELVE